MWPRCLCVQPQLHNYSARVMMVGIRPEVAQTMVALGIDLRTFTTYSNLHSALTVLMLPTNTAVHPSRKALSESF